MIRPLLLFVFCVLILFSCHQKDLGSSNIVLASLKFQETTISKIEELEGNKILLTVPYNTNIKQLTPVFSLTENGSSIPKTQTTQDFSVPVYITTVSPAGGKKIYTLNVKTENQPQPILKTISLDSLFAGKDFEVIGQNFGSFGLDVSVVLSRNGSFTKKLTTKLIDSTRIAVSTPDTLSPGLYQVNVSIKNLSVTSGQSIKILYPVPVVLDVPLLNIFQGTDILTAGKYIDLTKYKYTLKLIGNSSTIDLALNASATEKMLAATANLPAGKYGLKIANSTNNTLSDVSSTKITIYDKTKPFILSILTPKDSIKAGKELQFSTINMDKFPIRYFQTSLIGISNSYFLNGVFDAKTNRLSIILPSNINKENLKVSALLTSTDGSFSYGFDTDLILKPL